MVKSSQYAKRLGVKKGPWTPEEDHKLLAYIQAHGHGRWQTLPAKAGLQRCGKSCRFRWINYLRPDIKRGKFTLQEEQTIIQLHALLGNRWSIIANHLHKRTDNEIKNYWNTHLKKRLDRMGIDPVTHKPKATARFTIPSGSGTTKEAANLSHLAQWESARLEAEARLVREAKIVSNPLQNPLLRSSSSASGQLPTSNVKTAAADAPGKPRCLDVLKAWERVVSGMFFVAGGSLESPTSMPNFSEIISDTPLSGAINPTGVGFNDNFLESAPSWEQHQMPVQGEAILLDEKTMCASETAAAIADSFKAAAALAVEGNGVIGNGVMEGLAEILVCRSDDNNKNSNNNNQLKGTGASEPENTEYQSCGGTLEENRIYWNSLCNPMDALPFGSDML